MPKIIKKKKKEKSQINNLTCHLKGLEKEEQTMEEELLKDLTVEALDVEGGGKTLPFYFLPKTFLSSKPYASWMSSIKLTHLASRIFT